MRSHTGLKVLIICAIVAAPPFIKNTKKYTHLNLKRQQFFGLVALCVLSRTGVAQEPLCTLSGERTDTITETPADTTYRTSYTPTVAGSDAIGITLDEGSGPVAIGGSPYPSTVTVGGAAPALSTAVVPDGTAGEVTDIVITVRDASGNKVPGEAGNLAVIVSGANAGAVMAVITENLADTTYSTSYTPTVRVRAGPTRRRSSSRARSS